MYRTGVVTEKKIKWADGKETVVSRGWEMEYTIATSCTATQRATEFDPVMPKRRTTGKRDGRVQSPEFRDSGKRTWRNEFLAEGDMGQMANKQRSA